MGNTILSFILIPAVAAVFVPVMAKVKTRMAESIAGLTFLAGLVNIIVPLFLVVPSDTGRIPADCMLFFTAGLIYLSCLCTTFYSASELETSRPGRSYFFSLLLLTASLLCGAAAAENFFTLYLYIEVLGLVAAAMLAVSRSGTVGLTAASDWIFITLPASVLCIAGISLLFLSMGNLSYESLKQMALSGDPFGAPVFAVTLLMTGLLLKACIFLMPQERSRDFRTDLPVSGHLVLQLARLGAMYAVFRISILIRFSFGNAAFLSSSLMFTGAVILVWSTLCALNVKDLKRMACFFDFSNAGMLFTAAGLGTPLSVLSALFIFLSSTSGTTLLLICGGLTERKKTRFQSLFYSHGSFLMLAGGLSQSGIPPFAGFWSRLLLVIALFDSGRNVYAVLAAVSSVLMLSAVLRQRRKLFTENGAEKYRNRQEIDKSACTESDRPAIKTEIENHSNPEEDFSAGYQDESSEYEPDRRKEFLLDPLYGNGEKWLKLLPAWFSFLILLCGGILFPFLYMYLHLTTGSLFL
ncbi:MAG: hypothetical protein J6Z08_01745 [Elusimicrobiales bacterium]|nr:hypothetical protein [Elusimicrobiales bacterium]